MKLIQMNKQIMVFSIFLATFTLASSAQNSVSIFSSASVSLDLTSPFIAGAAVSNVSTNTSWLNYNIVHTPPEPTFSITVEISTGTVPDGLELRIEAGTYTGPGGEQPGTPTGELVITNSPQILVNNIGTCNSGSGPNVGHQLTYSYIITNYSQLSASSGTINILYTIIQL